MSIFVVKHITNLRRRFTLEEKRYVYDLQAFFTTSAIASPSQ